MFYLFHQKLTKLILTLTGTIAGVLMNPHLIDDYYIFLNIIQ